MTAPFYDQGDDTNPEFIYDLDLEMQGPPRDPDLIAYSYIHGIPDGKPFPREGDDMWGEHTLRKQGEHDASSN